MNPIHEHKYHLGGLIFTTKFIPNGDPDQLFTNQILTMHTLEDEVNICLCGTQITSTHLRELANQLDIAQLEAKSKLLVQQNSTVEH